MVRQRLPLALSLAAVVIAVFGSTPLGRAAVAKVVPFARNADTVDRIHASTTPQAGKLLPLDANAKVPTAVLPASPEPERSRAWARYRPGPVAALGELIHLPIPDSNVLVRAKLALAIDETTPNTGWSSNSSIACQLTLGTEIDRVVVHVPAGTGAFPYGSVVVPFEVAAHRSGQRTAVLNCESASLNSNSGRVVARAIRISALPIDDLTNSQEP